MKLNHELIKKLAEGEIAVANSGTIVQIENVLKAAFPEDECDVYPHSGIYHVSLGNVKQWDIDNWDNRGEVIPVTDFFIEESTSEELAACVQSVNLSKQIPDLVHPGDLALFWNNSDLSDLELMTLIGIININVNCGNYFAIKPHSASMKTIYGNVNDVKKFKFMAHRLINNIGVKVYTFDEIANMIDVKPSELRIYDGKQSIIKP